MVIYPDAQCLDITGPLEVFALAMVEEDFGRPLALKIARRLVLYLKRDGGQKQYSAHLSSQVESDQFGRLVEWIYCNLDAALTVDTMAQVAAMSPRNFARRFLQEMGITPAKLVERARVEKAQQLLAEQNLSMEKVATTVASNPGNSCAGPSAGNWVYCPATTASISINKRMERIHYNFSPDSKILLVVPGARRDAWGYRDSWIEVSEAHNVLILSPAYPEEDYDFAGYHLGGVVSSIEFTNYSTEEFEGRINKYIVRSDSDTLLGKMTDSEEWIFQDFDRIFEEAVAATGSNQESYDIFGHSAGGQILHRMAVFHPNSKADHIIAANSGQYTLPTSQISFPFGLGGTEIKESSYQDIFSANLTVLVGEEDNESESRGILLFTPTLNQQGLGRLSRAKYFHKIAKRQAEKNNTSFDWQLQIVENAGHDSRKMAKAAAQLLYGG